MRRAESPADGDPGAATQEPPAANPAPGDRETLAVVAVPLLIAMWVTTHPYFVSFADHWLYTVQALHRLHPARYAGDLFFRYGSQDSFTLFSALYAPLVAALGLPAADLLATIAGQLVWFGGLLFLARTLFRRDAEFLAAAAAVILLGHGYGDAGVLNYAEAFLTPRPLAEGLTLIALALALRRRPAWASATLAAAALIHPLMALGGVAVLALRWAMADRRVWWLILAAVAGALALALAGVAPFDRALRTFDSAWFEVVREHARIVVLADWPGRDFLQAAVMLFLVGVGGAMRLIEDRRLAAATVIVGLGSLLVAWVGGDLLKDVLVVQLQVWRALWIVAVLANAVTGVLLIRLRARGLSVAFVASAATLSGLSQFFILIKVIAPVAMTAAGVILAIELRRGAPLKGAARIVALTLFGVTFALALLAAQYDAGHLRSNIPFVADALIACFAVAGLVLLLRRGPGLALAVAGMAALVASFAFAGARPAWERFVLSPGVPPGLAEFVPPAGHVYWEGEQGLEMLWLKLGRPEYYSCFQGSGIAFDRRTALDYQRMGDVLRRLNTSDFDDRPGAICEAKADPSFDGPTTREQIADACRALPDLDTLILNKAIPGAWSKAWAAPVPEVFYRSNGRIDRVSTFYRYDCATLR